MQVVDWLSKQAGKLADNFNKYKFYVKHSPQHIDSSTILSLTPYTSREEEALVPCIYRWSRIKNGIVSEVEEFKGNSFICQPSDVGCIIQAEVTSTDPEQSGTAYLKYGPVAIDVLLKSTIQNALSTNQARFNVDLHHGESARGCVLLITDDYIHLSHCNSSANYRFDYCLGEPLIQTYPKDATRLAIVFSQKFESETLRFLLELFKDVTLSKEENSRRELQLDITFLNRKSKDEFLFVLKGYNAKKQLKNSALLNKIEKLEVDDNNINYLLEIESLRSDLKRLFALNTKHREEKLIYYQQSCRLEQQISEIITSYTNIIQGKFKNKEQFEASFIDFQNRKDQAQTHRLNRIQDENNRLKEYIREKLDANFKEDQLLPRVTPLPSQNPFMKKPFAEMEAKDRYENILNNMEGDEELLIEEKGADELIKEKEKLEQKLNRSMMKIEKLEGEIEKYEKINRSEIIGNNQLNRSNISNRNNTSALEISTNKVIMEKVNLERKYARLKEENSKLKAALQTQNRPIADPTDFKDVHLKEDSLLLGKLNEGSQNKEEANREITRLRGVIIDLQRSLQTVRSKAQLLQTELKREKEDHEKTKTRLEKRISDLNEQISQNRNHTDVLNRSQHLSMEMDDYNQQQNEVLKDQNTFLANENERLTKMCEKYKGQYKRLKEINKSPV